MCHIVADSGGFDICTAGINLQEWPCTLLTFTGLTADGPETEPGGYAAHPDCTGGVSRKSQVENGYVFTRVIVMLTWYLLMVHVFIDSQVVYRETLTGDNVFIVENCKS